MYFKEVKRSKMPTQDRKSLLLEELRRELSTKGWTIRQSRSEDITILATKRNIPLSDFLAESEISNERKSFGKTGTGRKISLNASNRAAALCSHLEDLHNELSKERWSTIVGSHCDHNPRMPSFKSEVLRVAIPDTIEDLKHEGLLIKIKQDETKTIIMVLKKKPSLMRRLYNHFK
ncbi:MAG: hypothetical protein C5B47_07855 [Verrucomicrobia bacterium]|nr:MAG: hypothetical protein C5B47_07855 [Verrucomicrobiota bacterium]